LLLGNRAATSTRRQRCPAAARARRSIFDDDPFLSSSTRSLFDELDREVADLNSRIASELPPAPVRSPSSSPSVRATANDEATTTTTTDRLMPGGKGYARTRSSSGRSGNAAWSSSESVVGWGVEPPRYSAPASSSSTPFYFSPFATLLGASLLLYAAVAARFARAASEGATSYKRQSRWKLALLWPLLAAFSPEFKEELGDAVLLKRKKKKKKEEEEEEVEKDGVS
jgi:hypothetical protein